MSSILELHLRKGVQVLAIDHARDGANKPNSLIVSLLLGRNIGFEGNAVLVLSYSVLRRRVGYRVSGHIGEDVHNWRKELHEV